MLNKKNITIAISFLAILAVVIFYVYQKNEAGADDAKIASEKKRIRQEKMVSFEIVTQKNKATIPRSKLIVSAEDVSLDNQEKISNEEKKEIEEEILERQYWIENDEQIKEVSIKLIIDLYGDYDDMDFSQALPSEIVFVGSTNPDYDSSGYYLVVLRNSAGEIMARVVLNVIKEDGDKKLLEAGNVEPFPPSFTDPATQEEYRKAEKYPLTDSFPRISEEQAVELAKEKLGDNFSSQGLTDLFIYLPSLDFPYQVGVSFKPYYEFSIEGDEKKTIWINSEDGFIVDYDHLVTEISRFEATIEEGKLNPPPKQKEYDENND